MQMKPTREYVPPSRRDYAEESNNLSDFITVQEAPKYSKKAQFSKYNEPALSEAAFLGEAKSPSKFEDTELIYGSNLPAKNIQVKKSGKGKK